MDTSTEHLALAADLKAQETAAPAPGAGTTSSGYIRATHPDTGTLVTFVPGELLPAWVADELRAGHGVYDDKAGAWTLSERRKPKGRS